MDKKTTLFSFPCTFPIKIVGRAGAPFEEEVMRIIRSHVPDVGPGAMEAHLSAGGKYLAMTVTIVAVSQAQLDTIYTELSASSQVVVVL
jgi:putative lipoic acid-binding regulatory protein